MSSKTKKISIVIAMLLAFSCIVGGSIAWLTDSVKATNTFTVGNIDITLNEPSFEDNQKLYPGAEIEKDPTITVKAKSEDCYVYAMVENNLTVTKTVNGTIVSCAPQINADWKLVAVPAGVNMPANRNVYRYKVVSNNVVQSSSSNQDLEPLFTKVTVPQEFGKTEMDGLGNITKTTIEIAAYAHQAAKQTQAEADTAAIAHFATV